MPVNHRILRLVVAFGVGLFVAVTSFQWITDTQRIEQRKQEEAVVIAARGILHTYIADEGLEISDAVDRVREAGKAYLFPTDSGWELSGHYRRPGELGWHAYLMSLDHDARLVNLAVQDSTAELRALAESDAKFTASN